MKSKNVLLSLALLFLCYGCVTNHGHYAVLSQVEVDPSKKYVLLDPNGYGEAKTIYTALYANPWPELNEAYENALSKSGGTFMKNVDIKFKYWLIPIIYGEYTMTLQGEVWGEETKK